MIKIEPNFPKTPGADMGEAYVAMQEAVKLLVFCDGYAAYVPEGAGCVYVYGLDAFEAGCRLRGTVEPHLIKVKTVDKIGD